MTVTASWMHGLIAPVFFAISLLITGTAAAQDSGDNGSGEQNGQEAAFSKFEIFASQWDADAWVPKQDARFVGHIRDKDNDQWTLRMLAFQEVIQAGNAAVPFLVDRLENGETHERILAAQALGYLGSDAPMEPLLSALRDDPDAAVQLYAADSLGMRGAAEVASRWTEFEDKIRNRDVRRHMHYATERGGEPIERSIVDTLVQWDSTTMNTAEVGKPAPEFKLSAVDGEAIELADFRGKKNVVLVFIYGDT